MKIELYEEMNEQIADIIAIGGSKPDLYASAYIKALREENKAFKDKLESGLLVELPSPIGSTVYLIKNKKVVSGYIQDIRQSIILPRDKPSLYVTVLLDSDYVQRRRKYFGLDDYNSKWFTDKSQAEARLKELQEKV